MTESGVDAAEDLTDLYREYGDDRLPPGQRETDGFPVLSKSGTPAWDPQTFELEVWGAVEEPLSFSLDEFRDLP
ncbi:sulfite oxidase-like oxidoreductase, partial [Halorubrum sp. SS7]